MFGRYTKMLTLLVLFAMISQIVLVQFSIRLSLLTYFSFVILEETSVKS